MPKSIAPMDKQVGGGALQIEADKGEEQRQGYGDGDDQPGADVVKEEDQDHHHQEHAAQQIAFHRARW